MTMISFSQFTRGRHCWCSVSPYLVEKCGSCLATLSPSMTTVHFFFLALPPATGELCRADVDSSPTMSKSRAGCHRSGLRRYIGHGGSVIWPKTHMV